MATSGAATVVRETAWQSDCLAAELVALLGDPAAWPRAAMAARGLARPEAAARIVEDCEALMTGRW
jgi:UDP-N-acetylglucosamine:LPS N-acetylglucosamine transferase